MRGYIKQVSYFFSNFFLTYFLMGAVIAIVFSAVIIGLLGQGTVDLKLGQPAMPLIPKDVYSDGRYAMGNLPCGTAYLETLHDLDWDYSVWYLEEKVLAVVFIEKSSGLYTYWVDSDLDGRINVSGNGFAGDAQPASEFYKMVDDCGDGWFR